MREVPYYKLEEFHYQRHVPIRKGEGQNLQVPKNKYLGTHVKKHTLNITSESNPGTQARSSLEAAMQRSTFSLFDK